MILPSWAGSLAELGQKNLKLLGGFHKEITQNKGFVLLVKTLSQVDTILFNFVIFLWLDFRHCLYTPVRFAVCLNFSRNLLSDQIASKLHSEWKPGQKMILELVCRKVFRTTHNVYFAGQCQHNQPIYFPLCRYKKYSTQDFWPLPIWKAITMRNKVDDKQWGWLALLAGRETAGWIYFCSDIWICILICSIKVDCHWYTNTVFIPTQAV